MSPCPLALLLDYIMSKFPVASRPLARPSIRLPDNISSDQGRNSSAGLLQPDEQEGVMRRILSLPPWRCWLTTLSASLPATSKPLARLSDKLPDDNRLIMAAIRLQVSCNWTNGMVTRRIISLPPWRYYLTTLRASF